MSDFILACVFCGAAPSFIDVGFDHNIPIIINPIITGFSRDR